MTPVPDPPDSVSSRAQATYMFREAAEAPQVVRRQLDANRDVTQALGRKLREVAPVAVVTCARGSSDNAATYARYLIETRTGVLTSSAAPSVSSVYEASTDMTGVLVLAISESGASPDLLKAVETARAVGSLHCRAGQRCALAASVPRGVHDSAACGTGSERGGDQGSLASLTAVAQLIAAWVGDGTLHELLAALPERMSRAWELHWSPAVDRLRDASSLYVLGRGLGHGLAQDGTQVQGDLRDPREGISAAEVRHGPMALVRPGFPVLVYGQDDETRPGVETVASDLVRRGSSVTVAGLSCDGALELPTLSADPAVAPMLLGQSFYRLVNSLSVARGLDPDRPPHLSKVTETL